MNELDYRKGQPGMFNGFVAYRKALTYKKPSVADFAAGWNACLKQLEQEKLEKEKAASSLAENEH